MINRIKETARHHHMALSMGITAGCCALAFLGAFCLRFDCGRVPNTHVMSMWIGLPLVVVIRMAVLLAFRVHRGLYRYASLYDFVQLLKAISLGTVVFLVIWELVAGHSQVMPRSIYILDWMLCMALLMGLRIGVRIWRSKYRNQPRQMDVSEVGHVLIVGAGNLGEAVLRMVDRRFLGQEMHVVGFVDQNSLKQGSYIHGIPVLGDLSEVPVFVREHKVGLILFAITDPKPGVFEDIVAGCDGLDVRFSTVSVLKDAFTGKISIEKMRDLNIEDLLGRKPVDLDPRPVQESMQGKTVLVTGAGGSIGSELSRQIASFAPQRIILLDNAESPTFEIDRELRQLHPTLEIQPFIGDIKHADVVEHVFSTTQPDLVYHAAAYKHVPLMETHPDEAVLNNVRGTRHLAEAARRHRCQRFVMISSDKAVRPTNVMGATKRMCELVIQSLNGGDTAFAAVRFGNVLGSNGSVIPIFRKQIEAGGPLTVTHPDITRYFMTIPEAVSLVLQCGTIAEPGDIFVLDMGTPMKIMDLARNMLRLSGLQENVDISIEVTGLRPGEKMYEELVTHGETLQPTPIPMVNVLKKEGGNMACSVRMALVRRMEEIAAARKVEKVRALLWHLIELDVEEHLSERECQRKCANSVVDEWLDTAVIPPALAPGTSKGRVLAVVSNLDEEEVLKNTLRGSGYELDCLDSCEEAFKLLVSDRAYAAILCDYSLPTGTAWQFHDKIRAFGFEIPLVSTIPCDGSRIDKLQEMDPSIPLLPKPFLPHEFDKACASYGQP